MRESGSEQISDVLYLGKCLITRKRLLSLDELQNGSVMFDILLSCCTPSLTIIMQSSGLSYYLQGKLLCRTSRSRST